MSRMFEVPQRINTRVFAEAKDASAFVGREIAGLVRAAAGAGRRFVMGLATGSSPTGVYNELIRLHRQEGLSFRNVVTFNLDEYFPMQPGELQSYVRFMKENLFDHIDIEPANVHIPDGTRRPEDVAAFCKAYEQMIVDAGGLDFQLLGIGRTGHVGFNEPGSSRESRTRLITLDKVTRLDAASDFFGEQYVPRRALTMGVGTILEAKRAVLIAFGEGKSNIIAKAVEGLVTPSVPASFLQEHPDCTFVLDESAAAQLTSFRCPWLGAALEWTPAMVRKAVIWLSLELGKPILSLNDEDYNEAGLQDLLASRAGGAYEINLDIFRTMQETITGWPGGKPDNLKRPGDIPRKTDSIFPKRVVVFSPHPDDDVISMGGTLIRLADQGHEVHVAYQTSGNIAVFDDDVRRFVDFAHDFNGLLNVQAGQIDAWERQVNESLKKKSLGHADSPNVLAIKGLIRRGEARAAGRVCGVNAEQLHFLDLPFYETGLVRKRPIAPADVQIIAALLKKIRPHQIYAAGDLSDPHGTHRVCLDGIFRALEQLRNEDWMADCEVWLYRGAWQEWEPEKIEMAVPLSPSEQLRKRNAIFKHQSQKDKAMFPGADEREFWQRAEDRNRETARLYDKLGLPQFAAIEGFVRWKLGAK
jgi:glucosamine-6-phosphate deaminase